MIETIEFKRMPSFFRVKMSAELKKIADLKDKRKAPS